MPKLAFSSTARSGNFILKTDRHEAWIVHYIEDSIPPIRFGVLLGECVFNIRSALDNLVCGLIRTADSHAPCKNTQFPHLFHPEAVGKGLGEVPQGR